jgi:hypothetical protein
MGNLSALKIRNLKESGRYSDGGGLIVDMGVSGDVRPNLLPFRDRVVLLNA